jgi:hypothetical protein
MTLIFNMKLQIFCLDVSNRFAYTPLKLNRSNFSELTMSSNTTQTGVESIVEVTMHSKDGVIPVISSVKEGAPQNKVNDRNVEGTAKPSQQNPSKTSESEVEAIINQVASSGE